MELYFFTACPFCQRVLRAIDRLGIKDEFVFKDVRQNQAYRAELAGLVGNTMVPTLNIDGKPMQESADIVAYLENRFGK